MKIIKIFFSLVVLILVIPMIVIQFIWTFFIELPWSIAEAKVTEKLVLELNEWFNPSSEEKSKEEIKSKFQERLDKAMESVKKSKK